MVVDAVVVAREPAVAILGDPRQAVERAIAHPGGEDVPASLERRGDERDARAVRRPPRIDVDRAIRQERARLAGRQVEQSQLDGLAVVRRVDDEASVGGPVGLVVVSWTARELPRLRRA